MNEPECDADCDSENELIEWHKDRCYLELQRTMQECQEMGDFLMHKVIVRNSEIHERCQKPELFDRTGRLKSYLMKSPLRFNT